MPKGTSNAPKLNVKEYQEECHMTSMPTHAKLFRLMHKSLRDLCATLSHTTRPSSLTCFSGQKISAQPRKMPATVRAKILHLRKAHSASSSKFLHLAAPLLNKAGHFWWVLSFSLGTVYVRICAMRGYHVSGSSHAGLGLIIAWKCQNYDEWCGIHVH